LRLRKGPWLWLLGKEWRELMASRAWWVMLALIGPLVGVSFISAVRAYAELSEGAGPGCGAVCAPLGGVWAPTFSAYELAAIFLLPFVAIRLVAGDRQSGALKLELQQPMSPLLRMATKALVLMAGWLIAGLAAVLAIGLWKSYGGATYAPEIAVVALGHLLNAGLTIGLAAAAASVAEHPSTAAIITLSVTVGTWIIDFAAAIRGGLWERLASYTPSAMVAAFQHGLVQADVVAIAVSLALLGITIAAVWMRMGVAVRRRALESVALVAMAAVVIVASTFVRPSWDVSESRGNSFPEADEAVLAGIRTPLTIQVHLAAADPRRLDLERQALAKLRRAMPTVRVTYIARTSSGLFEGADPGYGEIWYDLGGRRAMSRMTTEEGVLETILGLAAVVPPQDDAPEYRGHPLAASPVGATFAFYFAWPVAVAGTSFFVLRRRA
jgi:ABC-2 type transport system permease protein